MSIVMIENLS